MDSSKQTPSSCHHQASCGEKTTKSATVFSAYQAEKAAQHPCYSSHAQHQFARMHLAVAPACNVQCHYCNRKYDCVNESRPGVVSEVLSIDEAVRKAKQVAAAIPQLSVIGIAGPGDPLANHYKTFQTLERLRSEVPDIKLCISTNGLALPAAVTDLVRLGVDHVTVTLNAIDAHIGAQIYDWFYLNGQRYRGKEGAQLLIDQQVEGIRKLVEQGILVKVNTVLIPGINELHVGAVGQAIQALGVCLHNIMPLMSKPEYGTYFGLNGQREPTADEVSQAREASAVYLPQMRHCRQCRADAIGMLGEDRSQEFTMKELASQIPLESYQPVMQRRTAIQAAIASAGAAEDEDAYLVAVATQQGSVVDLHFGHVQRFFIYSVHAEGVVKVGERFVPQYCHGASDCDEQDDLMARMLSVLSDIDAVFCVRLGLSPWKKLEQAGIEPHVEYAWRPVHDALTAWWNTKQVQKESLGAQEQHRA